MTYGDATLECTGECDIVPPSIQQLAGLPRTCTSPPQLRLPHRGSGDQRLKPAPPARREGSAVDHAGPVLLQVVEQQTRPPSDLGVASDVNAPTRVQNIPFTFVVRSARPISPYWYGR